MSCYSSMKKMAWKCNQNGISIDTNGISSFICQRHFRRQKFDVFPILHFPTPFIQIVLQSFDNWIDWMTLKTFCCDEGPTFFIMTFMHHIHMLMCGLPGANDSQKNGRRKNSLLTTLLERIHLLNCAPSHCLSKCINSPRQKDSNQISFEICPCTRMFIQIREPEMENMPQPVVYRRYDSSD